MKYRSLNLSEAVAEHGAFYRRKSCLSFTYTVLRHLNLGFARFFNYMCIAQFTNVLF